MPAIRTIVNTTNPFILGNLSEAPCLTSPPCDVTDGPCGGVKDNYDYDGAMKFTIAVVMVYGIGVIGLLGIYTKRKLVIEDKIKEGTAFVKTFERKRTIIERKARKSAVSKLVNSISGTTPETQKSSACSMAARACLLNIALPPLMGTSVGSKNVADSPASSEKQETESLLGEYPKTFHNDSRGERFRANSTDDSVTVPLESAVSIDDVNDIEYIDDDTVFYDNENSGSKPTRYKDKVNKKPNSEAKCSGNVNRAKPKPYDLDCRRNGIKTDHSTRLKDASDSDMLPSIPEDVFII